MSDWILTRTDTGETVHLPQDLQWADEFSWSRVAQTTPIYSLSGSLLVQRGIKKAGRPITLSGDWVWVARSVLEQLSAWSDIPDLPITLTHPDGRVFHVAFRLHDAALARAEAVAYTTPETAQERYQIAVNLMEV